MAPGDPIPPERLIYRALSYRFFDRKSKTPKDIAFLLKDAHGEFAAETYLSFGIDVEGAKTGLQNIPYVCEIKVADIHALGRGLQVTEDEYPQKVQVSGMPLPSVDLELAFVIAKDLRSIAKI